MSNEEKGFTKGRINWFPGHMAKARREIKEKIKLVDVAVEIVDARIPVSSRNNDIKEIISNKPHLIVLNKSDLADEKHTQEWIKYYKRNGILAISMQCNSGKGIDNFIKSLKTIMKDKIDKWNSKGMIGREIKAMVLGEPNTGKSSLINRLARGLKVKTENRPGVTRGNQWISTGKGIQILDTPGILPPKINGEMAQLNLSFTGAIKDDVIDIEAIAVKFLDFMCKNYPQNLIERYKLKKDEVIENSAYEVLECIGRNRSFLIPGGEVDTERVAGMLLSEFRSGKMGKITLERCDC